MNTITQKHVQGPTSIARNYSNVLVAQTYIHYDAENQAKEQRGEEVECLKVYTSKNSRGEVVSSGTKGKLKKNNGYTTFETIIFQSPHKAFNFGKKRVTEKVLKECHDKGLDLIKAHFQLG